MMSFCVNFADVRSLMSYMISSVSGTCYNFIHDNVMRVVTYTVEYLKRESKAYFIGVQEFRQCEQTAGFQHRE